MNILDFVENALRTCLCEMLIAEGRPVCACHHFGGAAPPVGDRCNATETQNGQAWVRRVSQVFSVDPETITFGGQDCGAGWAAEIELGIYRCIQGVPEDDGKAPDVELYNADRELLAADRATLARVLCCWPLAGEPPEPVDFDFSLNVTGAQILPSGPSGKCGGSIMTIALQTTALVEDDSGGGQDGEEPIGFFVSRPAGGG